ncbi:MAG: hypothetical protein IPH75_03230 [bacterium]|nr:hypothetical protein [bacterium]
MSPLKTAEIAVVDLLVDAQNPRFEKQNSQREAITKIVTEQGNKIVSLATHIAKNGLNQSELPIVTKEPGKDKYVVLEGNRRIAAIKLLSEPQLVNSLTIPESIARKLKELHTKHHKNLPLSIRCVVAASREEAGPWIEIRHLGENGGVGIIRWDGVAAGRFRGESPEWLLLQMVSESEFLDQDTRDKLYKLSITNIKRILDTPEARRLIGVDVKDGDLVVLGSPNEVMARLAIVVSDIANKHVKVTQLDSKEQRVEYAKKVIARELPKHHAKIGPTDLESSTPNKQTRKSKQRTTRSKGERKTLIPTTLNITLTQKRIAEIFGELQTLPIEKYKNSCAVLLRVLLEMSLSEYSQKRRIPLTTTSKKGNLVEMNLAQKLLAVANDMEKRKACEKKELQGIRELANSKNKVFSIQSWHAYVHNQYYHPNPKDLRNNWDNIEAFFVKLWN